MGRGFPGFGRHLGEILPTSLPELTVQLRDLRNNQKALKTYFLETITNQHNPFYIPLWVVYKQTPG